MKTSATLRFLALGLPLLLVGLPSGVQDLDAQDRSHWVAWHGCWEAAEAQGADDATLLVCFHPGPDGEGVEIRTYLEGELLATERVIADGTPAAAEEEGCAGTRTAFWSEDGARVFIESELECAPGVTRSTAGVMALAREGREFLEIHAVRAGRQAPVLGVRRFAPASRATLEAQGIEPPARDRQLQVRTARTALSAPLTPADVVEVVEAVGADVARALVAERAEPFDLSAGLMRDLARAGVPGDVLDVMVAVTYPERFEIEGASWHAAETRPAVRPATERRAYAPWPPRRGGLHVGYFGFYDPFFFGYSPFFGPRSGFFGPSFPGRVIIVQPVVRDRTARVSPRDGYSSDRTSDRSAVRRSTGTVRPPGSLLRDGRPSRNIRSSRTSRPSSSISSGSNRIRITPRGVSSSRGNSTERRATRNRGGGGG